MKKKVFYSCAILLTTVLLLISIFFNLKSSSFKSSNVKETISLLASEPYEGRLSGSPGNILAENYIADIFSKSSANPITDSYKEEFTAIAPFKTESKPFIKIFTSGGSLTHNFEYGVDFKEDLINFRNNSSLFSKSISANPDNHQVINIYTRSIEVIDNGKTFLFYIPTDNNFDFRSSFLSDLLYDMLVLITTDTYNKMITSLRDDSTISINIPYENRETTMNNVVGIIEGKDKTLAPLVLSAHFDHLGVDGYNNLYGGALDNASGTSFLLELLRTYSSYPQPERSIVFAALNAEEFGLLGSKSFSEKNLELIKNSEVINFDMIGSEGYPITLMVGKSFTNKNSNLLTSIENLADKNNIKTRVVYEDSSDHASFNNLGIDSLSFCHSDLTRIHTPNDKVEFISLSAIDDAYKLIEDKINETYKPIDMFFYNNSSVIIFSSILILLILSKYKFNKIS